MGLRFSKNLNFKNAPRISLGALFCALALLFSTGCDQKSDTPQWDQPAAILPAAASQEVTPEPSTPTSKKAKSEVTSSDGIRFIAYNVENWLTMDRFVDRKMLKGAPKPDREKQAVVDILTRHTPDVIGLCEIGNAEDLAEIQEKLKAAGLHLPHSHFTGGADLTRHLGLLSRFPITSTAKPAEMQYQLGGTTMAINRGILDATVQARGKPYRFIGVHLKSKRESEQGDQEVIRNHEARLLRRHVDSILKSDPASRLIVYGDFNDTRPTPVIKRITGNYRDPGYLTAIPAKDSNGHAWTHHWALHDVYSRIDFIMVNRALRDEVNFPAAKIIDDNDWETASDHRPILAIFR
jgi:endonuclease/exonuclease/phosphatase family metal-dependent hydrolase